LKHEEHQGYVVGFGGIGRLTGQLGRALGMRTVGHDPNIPAESRLWTDHQTVSLPLDDLVSEADVVSLHVPLSNDTRNLFDAPRIARMRHGAILINTARGGVVDEAALAAALREGQLGGAALDVFAREPLPAGSLLANCPNLLLTPHIAGVTFESTVRVSTLIADEVAAFLDAR
jgi:(S)-sulfolactate dehydrogenase